MATLIAGSLHKKHVLEQFAAVGIYLQVESLLSTYGNEMGMLQVTSFSRIFKRMNKG